MPPSRFHLSALGCLLGVLAASLAPGQTAPTAVGAPAADSPGAESTPVKLDPFEVTTARDTDYGAAGTNSVTRFNVELDKMPVVADVFTEQFIQDTGVTTVEDLMRSYGNGAGMMYATPSSDSTNGVGNLTRFSSSQFSIRDLSGSNPRLDGFQYQTISVVKNSLWDVDRVDVVHGSQGLLFGASGGGGFINLISKQAKFDDSSGSILYRIDQYGTHQLDVDQDYGNSWVAARVDLMEQDDQTRFLYVGDVESGLRAALAFHLPFSSTLRVMAENTRAKILNSSSTTVNMGGNANDPRNGDSLGYLMLTNQLGAINPSTGQAYPAGAIDNGHVNPGDIYSWAGEADEDNNNVWRGQVILDSVWTSWLSTEFGVQQDRSQEMRNANAPTLISPPINGVTEDLNTLGDWAVGFNLGSSESDKYTHQFRGAALITNELLHGNAQSKTSIGFDRIDDNETGGIAYNYYKSDQYGNIAFNPATSSGGGGGRTIGPSILSANSGVITWNVGGGAVEYPASTPGAKTIYFNGQYWTRMVANPRSPAWVTPNNPLGLASLYANYLNNSLTNANGISGGNSAPYANHERDQGYYLMNYTSWWNDTVTTMAGFRLSSQLISDPNTTATIDQAYIVSRADDLPSYNLGVDFKIPHLSWLRGYAEWSRTFNVLTNAASSTDADGNLPAPPLGHTYEAGLKFGSHDNRISGSLTAYTAITTGDLFSAANFENIVNPVGISGLQVTNQAKPNNFDPLNKQSNGLELMLTSQPTSNWRMRFSADIQDGTISHAQSYPMLYNDQFHTDGQGNVTYANGQPVLVPTDSATLTKVGNLAAPIDPTTYGVALTPLTVAMINNPASPYYAFGQNTAPQNEPINGAIATPVGGSEATTNYLSHVLKYFENANTFAYTGVVGLPLSAMQYDFADPAGLKGNYSPEKNGDRVVGAPAIAFNFFTQYTFSSGWRKGFGVGGGVSEAWYNSQYYYQVGSQDQYHLFSGPTAPYQTVNGLLSYRRKFGRIVWSTQLNISNLFNHYVLAINPSNGNGFNLPSAVSVSYYGFPRAYAWTNTLSF